MWTNAGIGPSAGPTPCARTCPAPSSASVTRDMRGPGTGVTAWVRGSRGWMGPEGGEEVGQALFPSADPNSSEFTFAVNQYKHTHTGPVELRLGIYIISILVRTPFGCKQQKLVHADLVWGGLKKNTCVKCVKCTLILSAHKHFLFSQHFVRKTSKCTEN